MPQVRNKKKNEGLEPLSAKDAKEKSAVPKAPPPSLAQNMVGSETAGSTSSMNTRSQDPPSTQPPLVEDVEIDEDDMLLEEPGDPPPALPPATDKMLLAMRQQYKKTKTNAMRVESHLDFIRRCKRDNKIPKGLQVGVQCNAFLQDLSNVKQQFAATKTTAEEGFSAALQDHYATAKTKVDGQLADLERTIAAKLQRSTPEE